MMSGERVVLFSDIRGREGYAKIFFPISTMAIGTILRAHGLNVRIVDAQVDEDWPDTLRRALPQCLFLGISALTGPSLSAALDAVALAREIAPGLPVVWGGYHATHNFRAIFAEGLADYVIRGAGEEAAVRLAEALQPTAQGGREELLDQIPGLVRHQSGELRINPQRKLGSMGSIPPLDYALVDAEAYLAENGRVLHTITSYGCPHGCSFCVEPTQSLRRWRGRDPGRVVDQFEQLIRMYQPRVLSLHDPNFSSSPQRVADIVSEILRRGLRCSILCDMRARDVLRLADLMDLQRLREAGFDSIFLGLESGSDRMLALLRKGSTAQDAIDACVLLDRAGITTLASFMHDIPGETAEDSAQTFELLGTIGALRHNRQRHHFFTPYPATPLFDQLAATDQTIATRSQRQWAETGTYWGSTVWPGRPQFRRQIVERLRQLSEKFPWAIEDSGLPQLETPATAYRARQRLVHARGALRGPQERG
ncbi:B12-binding domain-containing radical SAM protein [Micromonospora sp. NPDC049836]|uniref:B12-binding domain-containing radical SAM protein n=1 Tax=Micromonospora sp. NPDC049836 TaxID=3364274 RepID=UPI0037A18563